MQSKLILTQHKEKDTEIIEEIERRKSKTDSDWLGKKLKSLEIGIDSIIFQSL